MAPAPWYDAEGPTARTHRSSLGMRAIVCYSIVARLAAAKRISAGEAIRQALEAELRAFGAQARPRRRMTVEQMRALGAEIAALPLLDPRSPAKIMEDLNAL